MSEATQGTAVDEVTEQEIRLFKTTLLARRFPGLKSLPDRDIRDMIIADRKAAGRKLAVEVRTYPKTDFAPASPRSPAQPPVFYPINPSQAKEQAKRPDHECFNGIGTPYDADHSELMEGKLSDESKRCPNMPFRPSCTSQARDTIRVDYYLNSKDAEGKQAELADTRRRAAEQMQQYSDTTTQRRGKTLV